MALTTTTGAGLEGVVAGESEICFIDGEEGVLSYRGYNIHTLADNATFEEVIFLLWNGRLPQRDELSRLKADLVAHRAIPKPVQDFLGSAGKAEPMDVLRTAVSMLSLYDPLARDQSPEANAQKAVKLMAQTPTIVSTFDRLRRGREFSKHDYHDESDRKRADQRRKKARQALRGAEPQERGRHRRGDPEVVADCEHEIQAEAQEHARHHAHHDRHRHRFHRSPHPSGESQREHKDSGRDVRADHFRVAQMSERGPDQNRAWNGPEKDERLAVEPAEGDADQPVHDIAQPEDSPQRDS